jgi:porphobilinogen synthase
MMPSFPSTRLRRNRQFNWLRDLTAETHLHASDLILPMFIIEGHNLQQPIASMPGVTRLSIDLAIEQAKRAQALGIKAIILFPVIDNGLKSEFAEESYKEDNLICRAIKAIKQQIDIGIIADVALDPYTTNGHDGVTTNDYVDNDATLKILAKQALAIAASGCDIIAPSDMMDGRIGHIRAALDANNFHNVGILAYAAKYASSFYGPFRDAVNSKTNLGKASKLTYQMDPRNSSEALREIALDIKEGADMIMIKPATIYLDIIAKAKDKFHLPIFAYQVSGEYAMLQSASASGFLDYDQAMLESLIAIKRAGAQTILTYAAIEVAEKLCKNIV